MKAKQVPKNYKNPENKGGKNKNTKAIVEDKVDLAKLQGWWQFCETSSRKKHWEWFVIDQFVKGNHDITGNDKDNTLTVKKSRSSINYPINKVYAVLRAVRGFVTRHYPKVEVDVEDSKDEESKKYARRANKTLQRDNKLNNFRRINKEWVYYGVKYGVGYRQVGYDKEKKVCQRWTIDPFDLFIGSKTGKMEDAPYLIKTMVRTKEYVDKKFDEWEGVDTDNELAASEFKNLALQMEFDNSSSDISDKDKETLILKECWYRTLDRNSKGGYISKVYFTEAHMSEIEETPFEEYPFIAYEAEVLPNEAYPDGHIKQIISPQRMFNMLNTQLLEYNHIVNRGRIQAEKGSGFKVITTKEGQVILHKKGKPVRVLNPPSISPLLWQQLQLAKQMIEDIGGQSDAVRGVAPFSGASGAAIEKLQVAGTNDISDLRDNFEDALEKEASWILYMYSMFEDEGVEVIDEDENKEVDKFAVVGAKALEATDKDMSEFYSVESRQSYDVFKILPDNNVKVSVTSELGETKAARQELLFKFLEAGLPLKTVLEHFEFPNTQDILQRIAEEAAGGMVLDQLGGNQTPAQIPGQDEAIAQQLESLL